MYTLPDLVMNNNAIDAVRSSPHPTRAKTLIGNLVEILLEELDIEFLALGSTTFKNEIMAQAVEADECFYIQNEAKVRGQDRLDLTIDPPPDLAIEIDITFRTLFDNYEQLGIPELWRYDGEKLEINLLQDNHYVISASSAQFPDFPVQEWIHYYIKKSKLVGRNTALKEFKTRIREKISK
ncbi:MAG: Uma2 family endonuclease [Thioploca sp.]|nr:Uma2 family endonuclease [Thioploca sp.]